MTEDQPAGSVHSDGEASESRTSLGGANLSPAEVVDSVPVTGPMPVADSPVAAALARLDGLGDLPLHQHPDAYQAIHADLQNALAAIDDA